MQKSRTAQTAIAAAEISHVASVRSSSSGWRGPACPPSGAGSHCRAPAEQRPQGSAAHRAGSAIPLTGRDLGLSGEPSLLQTKPVGVNAVSTPTALRRQKDKLPSGCFSRGDVTCVIAGYTLQEILHFKQPATPCTRTLSQA